jgi:hypothetical protein
MTRVRTPRPRLGPEFTDQQTLLSLWAHYRRNHSPLETKGFCQQWRVSPGSTPDRDPAGDAARWIVRNAKRFGLPVQYAAARFLANYQPPGTAWCREHYQFDDVVQDIAAYAAQRWAEAALRAALAENEGGKP